MNERIKELAEQAFVITTDGKVGHVNTHIVEKFAELIVKECIQGLKERIATRYQGSEKDRDIAYGMEIVYLDIVDKFGVEA